MNPVTRTLLARVRKPNLARFVRHWDALEALVIRVYRAGQASRADEAEWTRLRKRLPKLYARRADDLNPHWRSATVAAQPATRDPFAALLAVEQARDFVDNWAAMQTLPAAREALNTWLATLAGD